MEIANFFPIPIGRVKLQRELNQKEINQIENLKKYSRINLDSNRGSIDNNILDNVIFSDLKRMLLKHLNEYLKNVADPDRDIQLYITNSWINWNDNGTGHHPHHHPNSLISGVLYIDTDELDTITFLKPGNNHIFGNIEGFSNGVPTKWLSDNWTIPAIKNNLLIFPSVLKHKVLPRPNTCKRTRISISFNSWFSGILGDSHYSNKLKMY